MKIAICTNHYAPSVGGCELVTRKIAESLHDHEVYVLTRRIPGRDKSSFDHEVIEYNQKDPQGFFNKLGQVSPDLVFVYSDVFDFFRQVVKNVTRPRLIVALCGANFIYSQHNYGLIFGRQSANIEKLICHSTFDRDYKFCSNPRLQNKTVVIPNGVDLDEFDRDCLTRDDLASKYGLDSNKKWLLNVTNFFPGKGQEHMLESVAWFKFLGGFEYLQVSNDIEFPIGKSLENAWKKKISQKRLSNVHLLKNLPREDVVALFRRSNVFATTSEKEVAPLVILEAMASRTPWVSFDVGNVRGLEGGRFVACRKDRKYHCVVGPRETKLFHDQVSDLFALPSLGELGRKQIEQEMTWDIVLPQYRKLFEK